jgi:hypothetical protein
VRRRINFASELQLFASLLRCAAVSILRVNCGFWDLLTKAIFPCFIVSEKPPSAALPHAFALPRSGFLFTFNKSDFKNCASIQIVSNTLDTPL